MGIEVIDILWITARLGCDGDTIAMAAASPPSIEDIVLGIIPGIPKVAPCLPCGVHMYVGDRKIIDTRPAPLFAAHLT